MNTLSIVQTTAIAEYIQLIYDLNLSFKNQSLFLQEMVVLLKMIFIKTLNDPFNLILKK